MQIWAEKGTDPNIKTPTFPTPAIRLLFISLLIDEWLQPVSSVLLKSCQEGGEKRGKWEKGRQRAGDSQENRGMLEMFN